MRYSGSCTGPRSFSSSQAPSWMKTLPPNSRTSPTSPSIKPSTEDSCLPPTRARVDVAHSWVYTAVRRRAEHDPYPRQSHVRIARRFDSSRGAPRYLVHPDNALSPEHREAAVREFIYAVTNVETAIAIDMYDISTDLDIDARLIDNYAFTVREASAIWDELSMHLVAARGAKLNYAHERAELLHQVLLQGTADLEEVQTNVRRHIAEIDQALDRHLDEYDRKLTERPIASTQSTREALRRRTARRADPTQRHEHLGRGRPRRRGHSKPAGRHRPSIRRTPSSHDGQARSARARRSRRRAGGRAVRHRALGQIHLRNDLGVVADPTAGECHDSPDRHLPHSSVLQSQLRHPACFSRVSQAISKPAGIDDGHSNRAVRRRAHHPAARHQVRSARATARIRADHHRLHHSRRSADRASGTNTTRTGTGWIKNSPKNVRTRSTSSSGPSRKTADARDGAYRPGGDCSTGTRKSKTTSWRCSGTKSNSGPCGHCLSPSVRARYIGSP